MTVGEVEIIRELAKPLCEFLKDNYNSSKTIIVNEDFIRIINNLEILGIPINED